MTFKEFMNTCSINWSTVSIYFDEDDWMDSIPYRTLKSLRDVGMNEGYIFDRKVDSWDVDKDLAIHVLLSEV